MTTTFKNITLITGLMLTLGGQSLALAQTVQVGETPEKTNPSALLSQNLEAQDGLIETTSSIITQPRKANWQGDALLVKKKTTAVNWDLTDVPKLNDGNSDSTPLYAPGLDNYRALDIAGYKGKVGTATQYNLDGETLYSNSNIQTQNIYSRTPNNYLLRANLNF